MININEYILTKSNVKGKNIKFPEKPIEDAVINFLEHKGFIDAGYSHSSVIFKSIEKIESSSYIVIDDNVYVPYSSVFFSKGGKITENNPCFEILVYKTENDIDLNYIAGRIHFEPNYGVNTTYNDDGVKIKYNGEEYKYFVKEINKYFGW